MEVDYHPLQDLPDEGVGKSAAAEHERQDAQHLILNLASANIQTDANGRSQDLRGGQHPTVGGELRECLAYRCQDRKLHLWCRTCEASE